MTIRRLLIANRGEIACRIIRTCRRLGIETVLAVSEADTASRAAREADATVVIGPAASAESYLNVGKVVAAAQSVEADAIHPGYGFLSENAALAEAADAAGVIFIGATAEQLRGLGDKLSARQLALDAGLPVVPGKASDDPDDVMAFAESEGTPILLKAVAGGGGKGIYRIDSPAEVGPQLSMAQAEAKAAFGDGSVYVEKFIESGRHIEVQVLGDGKRAIHLGERDCSVQRRYQKLIEEAPAPGLDATLRDELRAAAATFAETIGYRGAGTVEYLVDEQAGEFYFLEMNARIQVEHPVTEMLTGIDLVEQQIAVAEGRPLVFSQDDIRLNGHAIECRLNAESPDKGFMPSPGTIRRARFPAGAGIRVDSFAQAGAVIPPNYDSLVAKLIVHAPNREDAVVAMRSALARCRIEGIATNVALHLELLDDPSFATGGVDTRFLDRFLARREAA